MKITIPGGSDWAFISSNTESISFVEQVGVPEPSSMLLMLMAAGAPLFYRKRS